MAMPHRIVYYVNAAKNGDQVVWPGTGCAGTASQPTCAQYPWNVNNAPVDVAIRGYSSGPRIDSCAFCNPNEDVWQGTPGANKHYADVHANQWLQGTCGSLPTQTSSGIAIDGYTVNEVIPHPDGSTVIGDCAGNQIAPWAPEAAGSRGWGYYANVMRPMAQSQPGKAFLHWVADPQNDNALVNEAPNEVLADWFTEPMSNMLYWAQSNGILGQITLFFECYHPSSARALGRYLYTLVNAYGQDRVGLLFTFQNVLPATEGYQLGVYTAIETTRAARAGDVGIYYWNTTTDANLSTFNVGDASHPDSITNWY